MNEKSNIKNEKELMEEYGWIVHCVFETNRQEFNGLSNIHTHGLKENFDHLDLQVVLPINPDIIHPVLSGIVESIKKGLQFKTGERSSEVLAGMDVSFKEFKEGDRTVLRLLLPDSNGILPGEKDCDPMYERQLEELPGDGKIGKVD